jgi:hypothetical protein
MGIGGGEIVKVSLGEILEESIKDRDPCKERKTPSGVPNLLLASYFFFLKCKF